MSITHPLTSASDPATSTSAPSAEPQPKPSAPPQRVLCREITIADKERVVNLLARGFPERSPRFWGRAFDRLSAHPTPAGRPRYGYLLDVGGTAVGLILLIFAPARTGDAAGSVLCNVSSWYVEPEFRAYGGMLVSRALRHKDVTYTNLTPAPHTFSFLEAQGFKRYCSGRLISVPMLGARSPGARVAAVTPELRPGEDLPPSEVDMLLAHAGYGCVSVTCAAADGRHPFIFAPRRKYGVLPFAFLIYSRGVDDFVRFSAPLGRFLARRGIPLVVLGANGPVPGLVGTYRGKGPKYFKGPAQPSVGDVAYSEWAMFGV